MAIQKIRSYGPLLIGVVGIALFAFIAEELVRALSSTHNPETEAVGEIYDNDITFKEFNDAYNAYETYMKFAWQKNNFSEEETAHMHDQAWSMLNQKYMLEREADKLGLTVTDEELQQIIETGQNPILRQSIFANEGVFNSAYIKQFLQQYDAADATQREGMQDIMNCWKFVESQVRTDALYRKYMALVGNGVLSNPVSAKANYDARMNEATVAIVALPYTSVKEGDIQVSDADIKAKYDELKKQSSSGLVTNQETRSIKYITSSIDYSQADEEALRNELQQYTTEMETTKEAGIAVRDSRSKEAYTGILLPKSKLPFDVRMDIDSMNVGELKGPYTNVGDTTINVVKLFAKQEMPDSISFTSIAISVQNGQEAAKAQADSILQALNTGTHLDSIAKHLNQISDTSTVNPEQFHEMLKMQQFSQNDSRNFINTLYTAPQSTYQLVTTPMAYFIVNVTKRSSYQQKYDVAIIKRKIEPSTETRNAAYNKLSQFLAENKDISNIEKNAAKGGFSVRNTENMLPISHGIAGLSQTDELLRWTFDQASEGSISEITYCGEDNNTLLVVMVNKINKAGEMDMDEVNLKNVLRNEVIKDKKAEKLIAQTKGKTLDQIAQMENAVVDTLYNVSFASSAYVQKMGNGYEPALSGAVAGSKKGELHTGLRGNNGVYAYVVIDQTTKNTEDNPFDEKAEMSQLAAIASQGIRQAPSASWALITGYDVRRIPNLVFHALRSNAKVKDLRYKRFK